MENCRKCEICNISVHRASMQKHLRSKKLLENEKNGMNIPEWLFKGEQAHIKKQMKKVYNPITIKEKARENNEMNDKELDKELAKKMINPYYFIDETLKLGFKNILDSYNVNHANSLLTIELNFPDIGIETRYITKILNEMTTICARSIDQYEFKYHILFSASFYKINEEDQRSDEIELFFYFEY